MTQKKENMASAVGPEDNDFESVGYQPSLAEMLLQLGVQGALQFVQRTVVAPGWRVALLLEVESELKRNGRLAEPGFGGILGCIRHINETEGFTGFFRGSFTDTMFILPAFLVEAIAANGMSMVLGRLLGGGRAERLPNIVMLTFSLAATATVPLLCAPLLIPRDVVVTSYTADIRPRPNTLHCFSGVTQAFRKISAHGWRSLYTGVGLNALHLFVVRGTYYFTIQGLIAVLPQSVLQSWSMTFVARAVNVAATVVAHPINVVQRRMFVTAGTENEYKNAAHCVREIIRKESISGLFAGLKMRMTLMFVGMAVMELQQFLFRE